LKSFLAGNQLKFVLIGAFALRDKLRKGVKQAVTFCREYAEMNVRMISGDHINTARAVAEECKIIDGNDQQGGYTCMDAQEFEGLIGGFADREKTAIKKPQVFQDIMSEMKVLARARPDHKLMVVAGLK